MAQTGALAKDNHQKSWKYTSKTSRTDRGHQRKFSIFVLPLFSPREGRPPALKPAWGATLPLQEWRVGSCPGAPRSRAGLLLWDDMLLYIPIWTRLLWNVRKCVVSGRHRQCPLLPATARSQKLFCVCILFEFDVVHKVRHYIHSAVPVEVHRDLQISKSQKFIPIWHQRCILHELFQQITYLYRFGVLNKMFTLSPKSISKGFWVSLHPR